MGLWWKKTNDMPKTGGMVVPGDPTAWQKVVPLVWRFTNKCVVLKVKDGELKPYILFYDDGSEIRQYKEFLNTQYIEVRVGRSPIRFFAHGVLRQTVREIEIVPEAELDSVGDEDVTFV